MDRSISHPLDESRAGALARCVDVYGSIEQLCKAQIEKVTSQQEQRLESLFVRPECLANRSSPWHNFSIEDLEIRDQYLRNKLYPHIQKTRELLATAYNTFLQQWRRDLRLKVKDSFKVFLDKFLRAGQGIQCSLQRPLEGGPFYLQLEAQCRHWVDSIYADVILLGKILDPHSYDTQRPWYENDGTRVYLTSDDENRIFPAPASSIDQAEQNKQSVDLLTSDDLLFNDDGSVRARADNLLLAPTLSTQTTGDTKRLRQVLTGSRVRRHPLIVAELVIVTFSLIFSVAWSVENKDPQTGFTVGAVLLSAGTICVAGIRHWRRKNNRTTLAWEEKEGQD